MKLILFVIGILLFLAGIGLGIYVGFWLMFVGGLIEIINAIKAPVTVVSDVGFGVLKMMFAGFTGAVTFWVCTAIAGAFITAAD